MSKSVTSRKMQNSKGGNASQSKAASYDLSSPDFSIPFFHYLEVPKYTSRLSPYEYTLKLPVGMIHRLWVEFPKGCSGLAGVRVLRGTTQIFPLPDGVWLRSDNAVMSFAFSHAIKSEPYEVVLQGYNDDDTYNHTVWLGFEMRGFAKDLPAELQSFLNTLR
jgi:hypothetical protein